MNTGSRMAVTGTADDQLKTVACSGCGDEFSTKFTLKRHVSVHSVFMYARLLYVKRCVQEALIGVSFGKMFV